MKCILPVCITTLGYGCRHTLLQIETIKFAQISHHHYVRTYVLDNRHENRILGIESSWCSGCISLFGAMAARVVDVVILVIV